MNLVMAFEVFEVEISGELKCHIFNNNSKDFVHFQTLEHKSSRPINLQTLNKYQNSKNACNALIANIQHGKMHQYLYQFIILSAMLPKRNVLVKLIKANTSFLLYGQKASGKTTLVHSLFDETQSPFIEINCTLANKRANFLKLFNVELNKYLCAKNIQFERLSQPLNLDSWINEIKKLLNANPHIVEQLDNLYIFMDNIQEMVLSEMFLPSFYSACQKEFPFRFSFIFCGINFLKKEYTLELPFRTMVAFCMPKPIQEFERIITTTVQAAIRQFCKDKVDDQQIQKCIKSLTVQIKAGFDNIEFNLEKVRGISKSVVETATHSLQLKDLYKSLSRMINTQVLKQIINDAKEHGPQQQNITKRRLNAVDTNEEVYDVNPNLQYYPNLILTSIHLADYYNEKQDKRRFQDYKSRTTNRNKDLKKSDFKIGRHNINRIIAISQSLESQAKDNDKQKVLEHHSLDFYAQFQHLRKMNRLKFVGNKVTGVVKEQEVRAFLTKNQLKYEQFMSS